MKKNFFIGLTAIVLILVAFIGCDKTSQNASLSVCLTDAPADYQQVLIDIQDVQINTSADGNESSWQSLPIKQGVYNLLDFRNGADTLLANIDLPAGRISQMRLVLGANNQLKMNNQFYALATPSAQQSGLKFNVQAELTEGVTYKIWIDFDVARSVVAKGNGTYTLKPVIRTFNEASSGSIKGMASPLASTPLVQAIANGDTLSTIAGADGKFLLRGVPQGNYKVVFVPKTPYVGKTVENVSVTTGVLTDMGIVVF